jgi:signal peptidase II
MPDLNIALSSWLTSLAFLVAAVRFARQLEWILTGIAVLLFDVTLKGAALALLSPQRVVVLISHALGLTLARNTRPGYGVDYEQVFQFLGHHASLADTTGCAILLLAVATVAWVTRRRPGLTVDRAASVGFGLVIGGGMGNALDRTYPGFVVDYLLIGNYDVYNLADLAILVGLLLIGGAIVVATWRARRLRGRTG